MKHLVLKGRTSGNCMSSRWGCLEDKGGGLAVGSLQSLKPRHLGGGGFREQLKQGVCDSRGVPTAQFWEQDPGPAQEAERRSPRTSEAQEHRAEWGERARGSPSP